jgi:hypothetical protein
MYSNQDQYPLSGNKTARVELHNGYLNNEMAGIVNYRFLKLYETSGFEKTQFERFRELEMLEIDHR